MEDRREYSRSQLLNFVEDSYLERTSRPIYAIVFLLPFIVFYELGTIFINTDVLNRCQVRVVAFVWLQDLLEYLGFGNRLAWAAPAIAVVVILIGLQLASRKRWSFVFSDIWPMCVECILLAVPLIVLSLFLNSSVQRQGDISQFSNAAVRIGTEGVSSWFWLTEQGLLGATDVSGSMVESKSLLADIVTGIGAGIYEELVFRLILICLLMVLFQDVLRFSEKKSIVLSVVVSAALFSAHHHIVYLDGRFAISVPFNWTEFCFRTVAGVYFAVLFAVRGFAVTAGTHSFYDTIAVFMNAVFFQQ